MNRSKFLLSVAASTLTLSASPALAEYHHNGLADGTVMNQNQTGYALDISMPIGDGVLANTEHFGGSKHQSPVHCVGTYFQADRGLELVKSVHVNGHRFSAIIFGGIDEGNTGFGDQYVGLKAANSNVSTEGDNGIGFDTTSLGVSGWQTTHIPRRAA